MIANLARTMLVILGALAFLVCGVVLGMVFWPKPHFTDAARMPPSAVAAVSIFPAEPVQFRMRDGVLLQGMNFASNAPLTILFLHGALSSSAEYLETCKQIHDRSGAEIIALDLRGHGMSGGTPGDVAYIGQYEEDVADVLTSIRGKKPRSKIILAGHSMGGGIVMSYAALRLKPAADGYLLFSPLLGLDSPTMRTEPAPQEINHDVPAMKMDLPRLFGLMMINKLRVRSFNSLDTLFFNVPAAYPIHAYTFRAMASMTPKNYRSGLQADARPLLVIAGSRDEAFHADRFASVVSLHPNGETKVIAGPTHVGIVHSAAAWEAAADWIRRTKNI